MGCDFAMMYGPLPINRDLPGSAGVPPAPEPAGRRRPQAPRRGPGTVYATPFHGGRLVG